MKRPWFIKMFPGSASNWEGTESAGLAGRREVERHSRIGKERGLEGVGSLFESVGLVSHRPGPRGRRLWEGVGPSPLGGSLVTSALGHR